MALQAATSPTATSSLAVCRSSTAANSSKRKGNNKITKLHYTQGPVICAGIYRLKPAFAIGAVSVLPLTDVSGPPRYSMRVSSNLAYICRDCGYIYNDRTPFEKLPDNFFCAVCGAPKRRFRPYEQPISKNANDLSVRKARKEELKKEGDGNIILVVSFVIGVAAFAAAYFYLNSQVFN